MFEIDTTPMSRAFFAIWSSAARFLDAQGDGASIWLRIHPQPPILEHLSFRLGNQLFFVRVTDASGEIRGPGNPEGILALANMANGHPVELPMRRSSENHDVWAPALPGWGLRHAVTGALVDPVALITEEAIPMSLYERHDFAIQVVRDYLREQGFEIHSYASHPEVDPAIFFARPGGGLEWVVVRHTTYPQMEAALPENLAEIAEGVSRASTVGHFASVALVSVDQDFEDEDAPIAPLIRGAGMHVRFTGLEAL